MTGRAKGTLGVGFVVLALMGAAPYLSPLLLPFFSKDHRELEAARAAVRPGQPRRDEAARRLRHFEQPEAFLELLEQYRQEGLFDDQIVLRNELFATEPRPRDARVEAAIRALATDASVPLERRFFGRYLLEELADPTYPPEPAPLVNAPRTILRDATTLTFQEHVRSKIRPLTGNLEILVPEEVGKLGVVGGYADLPQRPWQELVSIAQYASVPLEVKPDTIAFGAKSYDRGGIVFEKSTHLGKRVPVTAEGILQDHELNLKKKIVVTPPARITTVPQLRSSAGLDHLRQLRALAALDGNAVHEKDAGTLEIWKP